MGKSVLDFNTCNLHGFPPNTKKKYSGLLNHWRNIGKEFNGCDTLEFAFKQRVLPKDNEWDLSKFDKKQKLLDKYVLFNLFDYDSQFIVFVIITYSEHETLFRLRSTDDGEFFCTLETEEQKKLVMKFVENNFKTMTFESLGEYLKSIGCTNIWGF